MFCGGGGRGGAFSPQIRVNYSWTLKWGPSPSIHPFPTHSTHYLPFSLSLPFDLNQFKLPHFQPRKYTIKKEIKSFQIPLMLFRYKIMGWISKEVNGEDGVADLPILGRHLQRQSVTLFQIQHLATRTTYLHLVWKESNQEVPSTLIHWPWWTEIQPEFCLV